MRTKAELNHIRLAPRKVRAVADLVRGKDVTEADRLLRFTRRRPARALHKLLRSAVANAENEHELKADDLYIAEAVVNEGPRLKRFMPRARGRADMIHKRTSHIRIVLAQKEERASVGKA